MRITLLVAVIAIMGCHPPQGRTRPPGDDGGDLDGGVPQDSGNGSWDGFVSDMASSGDGGDEGCPLEATWLYTIDSDGMLSSFKPDAKNLQASVFTDVGKLTCKPKNWGGKPFSMSVDRMGTAWVEYHSIASVNGSPTTELFKVSTTDATCTATDFAGPQGSIDWFGMGFSSNGADSKTDTLFIAGGTGVNVKTSTLGTLDVNTLKLAPIKELSGNAELSGSGKGGLYAFYPDEENPRIVTVDKMTGAESHEIKLPDLKGKPSSWAFGFWGGDYWIFLQRDPEKSSTLFHVRGSDGKVDSWKLPRTSPIVGAGVSTCAPPLPIP